MDGDFKTLILQALMVLVPMILSLSVHEFAHAFAAKRLGDDTAEGEGRLSLNPIVHIDPFGTVILPMLLLVGSGGGGGIFFGWAKPVPVNPTRFSKSVDKRTGMMITAAAGPISNLVLAILSVGVTSLAIHGGWYETIPEAFERLLGSMILINLALFVFNLIPVYPLDGQKVLTGLLPMKAAIQFERFSLQYGMMVLIGVVFILPMVLNISIIGAPVRWMFGFLISAFGLT